ncbi:MAG: hypothetical protein U9R06_00275 [Patescibacteria group bacterium]|nr:hypothetical protein [Patescibacteria group bacterium]
MNKRQGDLANKKIILNEFKNIHDYQEYANDVIKNSREIKKELKQCLIE